MAAQLSFEVEHMDATLVPVTRTEIMLTVGDPGRAFTLSCNS